ncbi:MAG: tyrosine-type recombinase/integrase [Actinomycetota bacterium]|nr:tyrosine-type recombinase/integrase [Actinomycetota bacterium]
MLRAAEASPIRARALVMLMLFTARRISEAVALDVDDVRILTRKGVLVVMGKGEMQREVPLNALVRQILDEWLEERVKIAPDGERALWIGRTGGRLSGPLGGPRRADGRGGRRDAAVGAHLCRPLGYADASEISLV